MKARQKVTPTGFFARNPVFRYDEFVAAHAGRGGRSRQTTASVLKQHVAAGTLLHLRRGLYATVPRGADPQRHQVDPYLVATKLVDDAIVAYHAALRFHGKVYSVWNRFHYVTRVRQRRFAFRELPDAEPALAGCGEGLQAHRRVRRHPRSVARHPRTRSR